MSLTWELLIAVIFVGGCTLFLGERLSAKSIPVKLGTAVIILIFIALMILVLPIAVSSKGQHP